MANTQSSRCVVLVRFHDSRLVSFPVSPPSAPAARPKNIDFTHPSFQVRPLEATRSTALLGSSVLKQHPQQHPPVRWSSESATETDLKLSAEPSSQCLRRILKVAIVGRPNAGKSTLINRILKLNICDASSKVHTTRKAMTTAFTRGDTQIVFVDTPGLVTKKELSRFGLSNVFVDWKNKVFDEADVIGIIHEVTTPGELFKLHLKLVQSIHDLPESKPIFIILNKADLVIDKTGFSEAITAVTKAPEDNQPQRKVPNVWSKFSKIFVVSALKNIGVGEIVNYLLEEAKPGEWVFPKAEVCDTPLHVLVTDLLRAKVMDLLPNEVPYRCKYEVEYMEENSLGEIICVALIKCELEKHFRLLVEKKKSGLKTLAKRIESDLYKIIGKVFRLRVVAINLKKNSRSDSS